MQKKEKVVSIIIFRNTNKMRKDKYKYNTKIMRDEQKKKNYK